MAEIARNYLMKKFCKIPVLLLHFYIGILIIGCDQEPLFWDAANAIPPIEPLIKGHPGQIAENTAASTLYSCNSDAVWQWEYDAVNSPVWVKMPKQPGGKPKDPAFAGNNLFVLDWDGIIWKWDGVDWDNSITAGEGTVEKIFGAGTYLFAGVKKGGTGSATGYSVLSMNAASGTVMTSILDDTGLLMGAAYSGAVYYLGILGDGVYSTGNPAGILSNKEAYESNVIGLAYNGALYVVSRNQIQGSDGTSVMGAFSGAIAVWTNGVDRLLLAGLLRGSGSYGYGYREIILPAGSGHKIPGSSAPTSVQENASISAIGKQVITHLHVMRNPGAVSPAADSDNNPIIIASTQKNGLWSYRTRNGNAQWNGEDNSGF